MQYFLNVRSVANKNQSKLRGFNNLFHQNSFCGIITVVFVSMTCGLVF